MKFDLADFWELDTKALMAINGGGTCGGGSCSSGGSSYRGGGSCSSSSSYGGSCGSGSYGGSCGGGNLSNKNNELKYQIPYDANDYHCDIKAYNEAIDHVQMNQAKGVYSLLGHYLGETMDQLPAGLYIVNGKKVIK